MMGVLFLSSNKKDDSDPGSAAFWKKKTMSTPYLYKLCKQLNKALLIEEMI